jgi:hypothetical protein
LLLGFSLYVPWLSASRTARVEQRADLLAAALLDASAGFELPLDEADREGVLGRFFALAESRGVYTRDLERHPSPPEDAQLCLVNKHYLLQLTESPPGANQRAGEDAAAAFEVTAWPMSGAGPGHCAFFYPENAARAYTRNLRANYAGTQDQRLHPGAAHRAIGASGRLTKTYTGADNERWVLF